MKLVHDMAGTVRNCFGAHVIGIIGTVLLSQLLYVSASSEGTPAHSLTGKQTT